MELHEDYDDYEFSDHHSDDDANNSYRKNVRRRLEDHLERKRLQSEFKDDFDELNGEFDWDFLEK